MSLFVCGVARASKFAGKWGGAFPYSSTAVVMNLKQKGKAVNGKIVGANGKYSVQGSVTDEIVNCTILFIKDESSDCENSYTATMELTEDDTLLLIYDGISCYRKLDSGDAEFIRY